MCYNKIKKRRKLVCKGKVNFMSRSYKKSPYCTDNGNSKENKKIASRVTRRKLKNDILPKGTKYKQIYCSYNICDYKFRSTKLETIENFLNDNPSGKGTRGGKDFTLNDCINLWNKYYFRK
jgi:hypothetical protein